ncbi:protein scarlet isoform X2 [Halyomorpha halys]|nr:protein scarlet isoform X2 [Halyomorpha halys]
MDDGLAFCWQNVSLYMTIKKKKLWGKTETRRLKLLNNVSGIVKSGCVSAVMGPSGAGKTTLLAALSQRYTGFLKGEIHLNGRPVDKELMLKMCGFVPQHDLAIETLTVREHLNFMATLKMDRRVSASQRNRIVHSLIQDLGLSNCINSRLCNLSGGERRRVSLSVQLITDPPLLICDEPTTGLDSYTAATVVTLLRQLASRGKAILASIHQPASGIFELFDTVSLLVPGGRLAYFGEVNDAKQYFAQMGLTCPASYNTAEFVLKQLNTLPDKLCEKYVTTNTFIQLHKDIEFVKKNTMNDNLIFGMEEKFLKFYSVQTATLLTQLKWLFWRSMIDLYRDSHKVFLRLAMYICTGILVSSPYIGTEINQEGIQNLQGLHYSVVTETVFSHSYGVMHTFPTEIPVLLREVRDGVYKPASYYLTKIIFLIPRTILETLFFCWVIFMIAGVNDSIEGFFNLCLPVIACAICSTAYGYCISAMFENISMASLLSVPIDFISYTFSGIFLQLSTVPVYLSWVKYISRFYYGLEALSIFQWQGVEYIPCSENKDLPCITTGEEVLHKYGYHSSNVALDIVGLFVLFLCLHFIGYLFIRKRSKKCSAY